LRPLVSVVTGSESAAIDAATIAHGVPSRALMQRAGAAAAAEITERFPELFRRGVLVLAGPGNNGGDGWVIARALASTGVDVGVLAPAGARSPDCVVERELALWYTREVSSYSGEGVVVDALLGTGASGPPRKEIADAIAMARTARDRAASVVAIDLPSGLDADTGKDHGAVPADLTITFGNVKRGHLVARGICGRIVAVDIGQLRTSRLIELVDARWVRENVPSIAADAHKGTRKKLLFHGGAPGIAGAVILGLRAALASGIGMVKARVHPDTMTAVHGAVPATLIDTWDSPGDDKWPDVLVIGPGLGVGSDARAAVEAALDRHKGFAVLDADALTAFAGDVPGLRKALGGRGWAILTPHPAECARLLGVDVQTVLDRRFDIGLELSEAVGCVVLLKGVPTVVSSPSGDRLVVAAGTPALATGGSGDLLSGIAGTLLAQTEFPFHAAAAAAWIHGRSAQLAGATARGTTLDDVLEMLPNAWRIDDAAPRYPILVELPAVPPI
jgi:ADP-dependent NAD(P)H-hydrate dehydratase / NAD(P)H-hydrate epimerase